MKTKTIATTVLLASVALMPVSPLTGPVRADGRDVVAGLIIGGIIGSAIEKDKNKKKSTKSTKAKTPSISAEQREANKEVQTALNYFGYNVGTPDGAIGPKSRAAIKEYQAFLGYPATGDITDHERTILVTSYHRAVAGGPVIAETVSGSVLGLKAVLIAQRDEMAGIVSASTAPAAAIATEQDPATLVVAEEAAEDVQPEVVAAADAAPALPSFMSPAGAKGSLISFCGDIGNATAMNGGMTTVEDMRDPEFALAEQFCLARGEAADRGAELASSIAGFTAEEISAQCAAFGPVLKDHVAAVSLKPAGDVLTGVEAFILSSGMSPAQLSGTAKVCLGVGYANDDMDVAIGSALLLTAMGEKGYAEYLGHHLSQGFGAAQRPDLSMDWYQVSIDAMAAGQVIVAPGMAGREDLIRKAAYTITGRAGELAPEADVIEAALPVFELAPEEPVVVEEAAAEPAPELLPAPLASEEEVVLATPAPQPAQEATAEAAVAESSVAVEPAAEALAVVSPESVADPAPALGGQDTAVVNAGAQVAIMAARLPFLIFSSY